MTADEVISFCSMLDAYWPSEWTEERYAVWVDAFLSYDWLTVRDGLRQMARTEQFPTVAALVTAVDQPPSLHPKPFVPELEPGVDRDAAVIYIDQARAALRNGKAS